MKSFFWGTKDCIFYMGRFVRGTKPGLDGGFDISEADLTELEQPHEIIVASAIFGKFLNHQSKNY